MMLRQKSICKDCTFSQTKHLDKCPKCGGKMIAITEWSGSRAWLHSHLYKKIAASGKKTVLKSDITTWVEEFYRNEKYTKEQAEAVANFELKTFLEGNILKQSGKDKWTVSATSE